MAEFKILKGWELETHAYHLLHEKSTEYYSRLNFYFMIPIIILSSSTGTLGLLNASETKFYIVNGVNIISIFIGIFGFVTAILTTIHNFLNIQKLESNHNNHAIEYSKISKEIKMHIYLSDTDVKVYSNIAEYIKQCKQNIDKLIESAPIIPSHVENSLDLKLKKIKNNHADEIDELITLVTHSDNNIQPILTNDVNIKVLDTIESEESYKGNESKNIGQRMSEIIIINREEKENFENIKRNISEDGNRLSEDSGSTDDGRKSLDIINKLKNVEEREKFK
tara:strand:+ start:10996 stop:11835 length:840 start_codon:yes stop_codon:yes gene_type:complete